MKTAPPSAPALSDRPILLTVQGITKAYPGVVANSDVSFTIREGEVHCLLGENGAGKSTMVKMIYGLVKPDTGQMTWKGADYAPTAPRHARATGVAMVFQHFSLFEALSVAENVALGMENPPPMKELAARILAVSTGYGLPLDPARMVGDLSAGERQRVEIVRCLLQDPKLLIMDEPTSVLTPQEVEILFKTLRQLSAEGTAILYISHKLDEIRRLCDAATILRRGKVVGTADPKASTARELAELMVGATLTPPEKPAPKDWGDAHPALQVAGLSVASPIPFGTNLKDVSFTVQRGQILGIAGVAGNGQDELLLALSGEVRATADHIRAKGKAIGNEGPAARRAMGFVMAPEDRLGHAASPDMSLIENAFLTAGVAKGLVRRGFIDWGATRAFAEDIIQTYDVRTPGPHVAARALSGGNLQKFVIGRELMQNPEIVVINQPTWGVDAAAAAAIRQAILDRAAAGAAVVVISQDLDELLEIADAFAVLNEGRLTTPRPVKGLTVDQIGLMMGGAHGMEATHAPA
jgi:general nucleoside transport system ATP-binding protein